MYKQMYYRLFNVITTALRESDIDKLKEILKEGQIEAENIYISGGEVDRVYPLYETKNETDQVFFLISFIFTFEEIKR